MDKKRYNLRDVARQAEVSVATVSRVLNTPERVSPRTRDRVESAMRDLRFVPSAAARAINSGRTRMVAALLPTLDNAIYARVVNGLEDRLKAHDLSLIVAQTREDPELELTRARQLVNAGAEGFILAGLDHHPDLYALLDHTGLPTVAISTFDPRGRLPTIGYDNSVAAQLAAEHLRDLGHTRIAVMHGPRSSDRVRLRRAALEALTGLQFTFHETPVSVAGGAEAALGLQDVTAVICFSDIIATGLMAGLSRAGLQVPDDISVMGIEDLPSSRHLHPPLTSIRLRVSEMGARAAEAMALWLEEGQRPDPICLASELMARASTAPPRDR